MSQKDSDPTLQGHPGAPSLGLGYKSAFAQPINHSGRGRDLLKAKLLKTRRSPACRSRSTQERSTDGCNNRPPFAAPNKMHPVATTGTRIARVTCSLARFVMAVTAETEIRAY
jgi:hypothetical protein